MARSPGHAFYDRLNKLLSDAGFDAFVEEVCKPFHAAKMGILPLHHCTGSELIRETDFSSGLLSRMR